MPVRAARPVSAIALTTVLALSACGGGDEPPPKETSSSTTDKQQSLSKSAEKAYQSYWRLESTRPTFEVPSSEQKSKMTEKAYKESADIAGRSTPTKVEGRDKLLSTDAEIEKNSDGYEATVEACYEVHRKSLAKKGGQIEEFSWEKGQNLRVDRDGETIEPGTVLGDRVTMRRDLAENASWKVAKIDVDVNVDCSDKG